MKNGTFNRRKFIQTSSLVAGIASVLNPWHAAFGAPNGDTSSLGQPPQGEPMMRALGTGPNRIHVSAIGLGCMGMSYHRSFIPDRQAMIHMIRSAADLGMNFFDTAEAYGPQRNEELVGEALQPIRKNVILATKFGFKDGKPAAGLDSRPERIRQVVDESLKRLRTDYIDLLYQHRIDPQVPAEDVAGTVKDLIQAGKVRHFGMSETDFGQMKGGLDLIRRAHSIQPLTAIQSEYSTMTRLPENGPLDLCEELGIGFVPYSPLSRGLISGYINERTTYNPANDNRASLPRYQPANVIANWPMVDVLKTFGDARGYSVAQVALAWLLAQKPFVVPIPGTTKLAHVFENMRAADLTITDAELSELTQALAAIPIQGDRLG